MPEYTEDEKKWPPGTIRIELLMPNTKDAEIILQPRPSSDPNDPLNWKQWEKYWNFGLTAWYTFMVFVLIDAMTPTWGPMNEQLGFSYDILNDSYAIGCGTLAIGGAMLIPWALKFGRRPIYIISTAIQFAMSVWSARMETIADLMLVNALSCLVAALAEVMVQMTVADMFFVHERGLMNSIFIWAQNTGGLLGPLAAGYITDGQGWRWVWWWNAIIFGISLLLYIFAYEETKYNHSAEPSSALTSESSILEQVQTHTSVVVEAKTEKTAMDSAIPAPSDPEKVIEIEPALRKLSVAHINSSIPRKTYRQRLSLMTTSPGSWHSFLRHSYQPFMILFTIPAVGYMSTVYGVMLAWSTVTIVTQSTYMPGPPWNFSPGALGLMCLPQFIGATLGSLISGPISDWSILYLSKRNGGVFEPEMRLFTMLPFAPFLPIGAFIFGFALDGGWSWPSIAVSSAVMNFGAAPVASIAITYVTDSYAEIVGDSLVGIAFTRNLLCTIFVFVLSPWIDAVGMANVYTTIGVIGIVVLAFVAVFIWKGKYFRVISAKRYRWYAERQYGARRV